MALFTAIGEADESRATPQWRGSLTSRVLYGALRAPVAWFSSLQSSLTWDCRDVAAGTGRRNRRRMASVRPYCVAVAVLAVSGLLVFVHGADAARVVAFGGGATVDSATPLPIGAEFSVEVPRQFDYYSLSVEAGDNVDVTVWNDSPAVADINVCATQPSWLHRNGTNPNDPSDVNGAGFVSCASWVGASLASGPGLLHIVALVAGRWVIRFASDCNSEVCPTPMTYRALAVVTHHPGFGLAPPGVVVSLGDSYAAGAGDPPYDVGTHNLGDHCRRSKLAWPRLVGVRASYQLACSGATLARVTGHPQHPDTSDGASQIGQLRAIERKAHVATVFLEAGADQFGITKVIDRCYTRRDCLPNVRSVQKPQLKLLVKSLERTYRALKSAAGSANLVVVGYPSAIGLGKIIGCPWLSAAEQRRVFKVERLLEQAQIEAAFGAGVRFLTVRPATHGHELCTKTPWFHPLDASPHAVGGLPTARAQGAIAAFVSGGVSPPSSTPSPSVDGVSLGGGLFDTSSDAADARHLRGVIWSASLDLKRRTSTTYAGSLGFGLTASVSHTDSGVDCKLLLFYLRTDQSGVYYHTEEPIPHSRNRCPDAGTLRLRDVTTTNLLLEWRGTRTPSNPTTRVLFGLFGGDSANLLPVG
jgi:hypothetical protein